MASKKEFVKKKRKGVFVSADVMIILIHA